MRDESQQVLDAVGGRRPNAKGNVRGNCPFCDERVGKSDRKQCLSLNAASGYWKCYRCDAHGRLSGDELPFDIAHVVQAPREPAPPVDLPEGFVALWTAEGQSVACRQAWVYLRRVRNPPVTDEMVATARVGCCVRGKLAGRVVVPIYKAGKLAGYMTRVWRKKHPRAYLYSSGFDRANTLYNEDALYVTTRKPVVVVEGIFDTFPFWPHAVAVLGKQSDAQVQMLLAARRPVLIVYDGDAHREATALAMTLRLHRKEAHALRLPPGVDPDEAHEHVKRVAAEIEQGGRDGAEGSSDSGAGACG